MSDKNNNFLFLQIYCFAVFIVIIFLFSLNFLHQPSLGSSFQQTKSVLMKIWILSIGNNLDGEENVSMLQGMTKKKIHYPFPDLLMLIVLCLRRAWGRKISFIFPPRAFAPFPYIFIFPEMTKI